jgi:iron complex transport system substrate-binding protein
VKKFITICLIATLLLGLSISSVSAAPEKSVEAAKVMIDGSYLKTDALPIIENERIMVPMRGIFEALGAEVKWDDKTKTAEITKGEKKISITLDKKAATVDGKEVALDVPAKLIEGNAMVSAKFVGEALACEVKWDDKRQVVLVNSPFKPVSIYTYNHYISFDKIPQKVVSMNSHTTEVMLALELEEKMIGTAYNNAGILPQYKEKFDKIPALAEKYPSFEVLLDTEADFVYGRGSVFTSSYKCATMDDMIENQIKPYAAKASYTNNADFNDVYEDFYNLGKIFNIENKAALFVEDMKAKIAKVAGAVNGSTPVKVFVYDFGTDKPYTAGKSLETYIIQTAGGKNIFDDIDKTWSYVNWETVVDRNPDYIVINDYGKTTAKEKIEFLKSNPMLQDINAIKNDNFITVTLSSVFPGIRVAQSVEDIAKGLHPEAFK